jgi:hypothetical protein
MVRNAEKLLTFSEGLCTFDWIGTRELGSQHRLQSSWDVV